MASAAPSTSPPKRRTKARSHCAPARSSNAHVGDVGSLKPTMPTNTQNTQAPAADCPYHLDATGSDIHGEAAALRERGPATRVLLPGDIPA